MLQKKKEQDEWAEVFINNFSMNDIIEVENYLKYPNDFYDIGIGEIMIEPIDENKKILRITKESNLIDPRMETTMPASALQSLLYDVRQEFLRRQNVRFLDL